MLRFALLACLASPLSAQTTWYVDVQGLPPGSGTISDPYTSIQFALEQSSTVDGDELAIATGTYAEAIDFLGKAVTARQVGPGSPPLLSGDGSTSSVTFRSGEGADTVLVGLEIMGTTGTMVGGILRGGAVLVDGASPTLNTVTVRDSVAMQGGGIAVLSGGLRLENCVVRDCEGDGGGGGIYVDDATLDVIDSLIEDNEALGGFGFTGHGGGIHGTDLSTLVLDDVDIKLNRTRQGRGGGIYTLGAGTLQECLIQNNLIGVMDTGSFGGGGIYGPEVEGRDCRIFFNGSYLAFRGGGAYGGRWYDSNFQGNKCSQFGAGLDAGYAERCLFFQNATEGEGDSPTGPGAGAAHSTLLRCRLNGNLAQGHGGGAAFCDLEDCIVRSNSTSWFDWGHGAGLFVCTARGCLIEGNWSFGVFDCFGGGAYESDLERCVVVGNSAVRGGGVFGGTADRCTIVHNIAYDISPDAGGGTYDSLVSSSILWGNAPEQAILGTVDYSCVEGGAAGIGNLTANPRFFGPGSDIFLRPDSPCRDAGDPAAPLDPDGSRADMGGQVFQPGHERQDQEFCNGPLSLVLFGQVSVSGGGAAIIAPEADLILISRAGSLSSTLIPSPLEDRPSAICLTGAVGRLVPASGGVLTLSGADLALLGFFPGDRLYLQSWKAPTAFDPARTSRALDFLVRP